MLSPKPHILYVDDDKDSCELAAAMFEFSDSDYVVVSAESAEEALLLIEVEPSTFIFSITGCREFPALNCAGVFGITTRTRRYYFLLHRRAASNKPKRLPRARQNTWLNRATSTDSPERFAGF